MKGSNMKNFLLPHPKLEGGACHAMESEEFKINGFLIISTTQNRLFQ